MAIKTLHVTNFYHPASGGIRTFYHALLEGANRLRRPMCLVVPGKENKVETVSEFGRIYQIKSPRSPFFDRRYRLILPHSFLLPSANGLRHILQVEQPDLVEVCDKYSVCWLAGAPRQGWIPGVPRPALVGMSCERMDDNVRAYISANPTAAHLCAFYVEKVYVPLFDFHIAVSQYVSEKLTGARPTIKDRVKVMPMGVDIEGLGPQRRNLELRRQLQKESGGSDATALLLYAGRLSPEKNLALLVNMMERIMNIAKSIDRKEKGFPDCRLIIAGDGPLEGWLRKQGERLQGRLRVVGQMKNREEIAGLLASVDVFVHPNPREPFGIGPLEAMASGTPVVVPKAGGVVEYADSGCAWLAKPEGEAFASAVLEVLSNPVQAGAKVESARRVAERHNWQNIAEQYFEAYEAFHSLQAAPNYHQ